MNVAKISLSAGVVLILAVIVTINMVNSVGEASNKLADTPSSQSKPLPKPADPNDNMANAQWYLKQAKFREASIEYRSAIQKNPGNIEAHLALARTMMLLGNNEEAIDNCQTALGREPANTSARVLLVNIYLSNKSYDTALQEAEAGLRLTPGHTELSIAKASAQEALGRIEAATATLLTVAKKDITSPTPYVYLGDMQHRQKEYATAVTSYEEALRRSPDEAGAAENIAMLLTDHVIGQSGRERAYDLATQLHQKYPANPRYVDTLGWVLISQGYIDQGVELLRRAAQQLPAEPQVRYHLGAALFKRGDYYGAAAELKQSLAPKTDFDGANQARGLLQLIAVKAK